MSGATIFPREDQKYSPPVAVFRDSIVSDSAVVKGRGYRMTIGQCIGSDS
jgi:hypothetical protein